MKHSVFYPLKVLKKRKLTKNIFELIIELPQSLREKFYYEAGQYCTFRWEKNGEIIEKDFSMTSLPEDEALSFGVKIHGEHSATEYLYSSYDEGDKIELSLPKGRFTLASKPDEFRTILGFATGIGITPILAHLKNILQKEHRTRFFLFYGNATEEDIAYKQELEALKHLYSDRLEIHYFLSKQGNNPLYTGRINGKKINLIINQILHLDDTDEESTLWDAVDEVLICGQGEMIKEVANACYDNGIRKNNIHFEHFESYEGNIYPIEMEIPMIENVSVSFRYDTHQQNIILPDNKDKILQALLQQGFNVPFSCKSGICGTCIAELKHGEVEQLENEYLTEKEEREGKILPCMCIAKSKNIIIEFL